MLILDQTTNKLFINGHAAVSLIQTAVSEIDTRGAQQQAERHCAPTKALWFRNIGGFVVNRTHKDRQMGMAEHLPDRL